MKKILGISLLSLLALPLSLQAQEDANKKKKEFKASFGIQSDMLLSEQGATKGKWLGDTYLQAKIANDHLELGMQFEDLSRPMPMHQFAEEAGRGVSRLYFKAKNEYADITLGDFYDQFGSGALLRSYEERNLGIDNAIRGARIAVNYSGLSLKLLGGQMRNHFDRKTKVFSNDRGFLYGADLGLTLSDVFHSWQEKGWNINLGTGMVLKEMKDLSPIYVGEGEMRKRLNLPKNIPAFGGRFTIEKNGIHLYGEYDYKINDPVALNDYTYGNGQVAMLMGSYSTKGFSVLLGAKRSQNFDNRADRSAANSDLTISYLPAFTQQQTYALAALHPYATQLQGEWAFQGELHFNVKRGSTLGGKYGMLVDFTASHVRGLKEKKPFDAKDPRGTNGPEYDYFKMGGLYYQDLNVHIYKKFNKKFGLNFTYLYQIYNQKEVEKHTWAEEHKAKYPNIPLSDYIKSHIFVFDAKTHLSKKLNLRTELQYLHSKEAEGDWLFALAELSILPNLMVSISDQWNPSLWGMGRTNEHYYMGCIAYTYGQNRFQVAYGRTRAGMNCSGGVCRLVPEMKGLMFSYTSTF